MQGPWKGWWRHLWGVAVAGVVALALAVVVEVARAVASNNEVESVINIGCDLQIN